jgi:hypothetical protein
MEAGAAADPARFTVRDQLGIIIEQYKPEWWQRDSGVLYAGISPIYTPSWRVA